MASTTTNNSDNNNAPSAGEAAAAAAAAPAPAPQNATPTAAQYLLEMLARAGISGTIEVGDDGTRVLIPLPLEEAEAANAQSQPQTAGLLGAWTGRGLRRWVRRPRLWGVAQSLMLAARPLVVATMRSAAATVAGRPRERGTSWPDMPLDSILYLHPSHHGRRGQVLDACVALGVHLARDGVGLLFGAAHEGDLGLVRLMLSRGVSANTHYTNTNETPLMTACSWRRPNLEVIAELLRASSPVTRRRLTAPKRWGIGGGMSAVDLFLESANTPISPQQEDTLTALLVGGVPVGEAENVPLAMRLLARHAEERAAAARAAVRRADPTSWRGNEAFVNLAFDFQDMRAAEEGVRQREARVEELEEELRALGVGTEETTTTDGEEEDEEMGEAAAGGSDSK